MVSKAKEIRDTAPDAPSTTDPNGWSSRNRWEWAGATDPEDGDPVTQFNGHDYMDLETLLETRNLSRNDVGPPVELIPNEDDPSLLDLYVRGGDSADSITLSDQGTAILVSLNGTDYGPLTPTGEIFVFGHQGADAIRIDGGLGLPCSVFGDEGSDVIQVTNRATPQLQVSGGTGTNTLQGDSVD